jgi:hypothetical protein
VPLVPVRAARAPRVVPTGHGAGAGRRASRSTSRARPGTRLSRARRARFVDTSRYIQNFTILHNTSRRRRRERTVRSRVCTTQRGHSTKEPPLRIRTIIVNSESDPESAARPLRPPGRLCRVRESGKTVLKVESKVKGKQENSTQDFESYKYRNISRLLSDSGPTE